MFSTSGQTAAVRCSGTGTDPGLFG